MLFSSSLDSLQCLIDFLGQISQVLGADRLNDDFFLIAQRERLSEITVCQGGLGFLEQGLTKLVADNGSRKQAMEAIALRRLPLKTE